MVLTGYFDESGTHGEESPVTTVAGFIANPEQWAAYESELAALNAEFGVKLFHAKDLRGNKGSFRNWQSTKKAQYTSRFLQLADTHLGYGLSAVLRANDYRKFYKSALLPRRARPDTAYGLWVRGTLLKAITLVKDRPKDWPLNVVMEIGHRNAGDAIRVFDEIKGRLRPEHKDLLGFISFASKADTLPLAIADSLAYAIFRRSGGYSRHPTDPNVAVVGAADPPYFVKEIPLSVTILTEYTLTHWSSELC